MKKFLTIASSLLFAFSTVFAEDVDLPLTEDDSDENQTSKDKGELPKGHRMPSRPVQCTISTETGVTISGVETDDIISFELFDESGELCFATFNNGFDFASFLFSLEGDYVIRFVTENKTYSGYISL